MKKTAGKTSEKPAGPVETANVVVVMGSPEIVLLLLSCGFGSAAVGWFLIGIGALFALIPLVGLTVYWLSSSRTQVDVV